MEIELRIREFANLFETNGSRLLAETLTTQVKTVFSDDTSLVGTQTAEEVHVRD